MQPRILYPAKIAVINQNKIYKNLENMSLMYLSERNINDMYKSIAMFATFEF